VTKDEITNAIRKYTGRQINLDAQPFVWRLREILDEIQQAEDELMQMMVDLEAKINKVRANIQAGPDDSVSQLNDNGEFDLNPDVLIARRATLIDQLRASVR
jgi:hypothetical protein